MGTKYTYMITATIFVIVKIPIPQLLLHQPTPSSQSTNLSCMIYLLLIVSSVVLIIQNKPLLIGFHLTPIYIDVTEDGFIEGEFWYNLAWNDFRLRWDEEARNIRDLHISKEIIWTPDIVPLSRDVVETIDDRRSAILDYKGEIIFFPRVFLRGRCNGVDLWNPWKEFNCSLKYGSWSHTKEYLDFTNIVQSEPIFFNDLSNPVNYPKTYDTIKSYSVSKSHPSPIGFKFDSGHGIEVQVGLGTMMRPEVLASSQP
ncbi:unnamed protein product [Lepeophtheirus salmonis]|uniref:(salmon louse) hypothetical protein n=1 Tax=Lepeophtheirus salmonis TaxID=72036 RepID=A0A7R8CIP9_LEPSM|nr:unnamed protein product [Lepeophtheirus salmonis]CAF2833479.1 unnamed protein product [Lepeophtheirus salmonis]